MRIHEKREGEGRGREVGEENGHGFEGEKEGKKGVKGRERGGAVGKENGHGFYG